MISSRPFQMSPQKFKLKSQLFIITTIMNVLWCISRSSTASYLKAFSDKIWSRNSIKKNKLYHLHVGKATQLTTRCMQSSKIYNEYWMISIVVFVLIIIIKFNWNWLDFKKSTLFGDPWYNNVMSVNDIRCTYIHMYIIYQELYKI